MVATVKSVFAPFSPSVVWGQEVNAHHNYVARETYDGVDLVVTRKGAISAKSDEFGLIRGSMGTGSYVVRGLGNEASYCSASHGAGRKMSRTKAKKTFSVADLAAQTEGVECRKDAGAHPALCEGLSPTPEVVTLGPKASLPRAQSDHFSSGATCGWFFRKADTPIVRVLTLRPMESQRAVLATVVLVSTLLVGCGETDGAGSALAEKWSRPGGPESEFMSLGFGTATDELWIYANIDSSRIEAVRLADGKEAWHLPLEENVCEISPVNEAGLVAVRDHPSGSHGCNRVTVVDTSDGDVLWSATFESIGGRSEGGGMVGLTETTVSVTAECAIERWEATSGDRLESLKARHSGAELGSFGCRVATTGSTALVSEKDGISGFDVDTGERVWTVAGDGPHVGAVYATDPIVADVWIEGAQGVRTIDPGTGLMGKIVGRSQDTGAATPTLGLAEVVGERIFGSYDEELSGSDDAGDGAVRAWDLSSGTEAWSRAGEAGDTFLGADENGVYIGRDTQSDAGYRVVRRDLDDGSEESLGTIEAGPAVVTKVGGLLLVGSVDSTSGDSETTAYELQSKAS